MKKILATLMTNIPERTQNLPDKSHGESEIRISISYVFVGSTKVMIARGKKRAGSMRQKRRLYNSSIVLIKIRRPVDFDNILDREPFDARADIVMDPNSIFGYAPGTPEFREAMINSRSAAQAMLKGESSKLADSDRIRQHFGVLNTPKGEKE